MHSLIKRGKIWHVKLNYKGQTKRVSTGHTNKKAAQDQADQMQKRFALECEGGKTNTLPGFDEAAARWLVVTENEGKRQSTMASYRNFAKRLVARFGSTRVDRLPEDCLDDLLADSREEGRSNRTIEYEVAALRLILRRYKCWARIGENWKGLPKTQVKPMPLTYQQEEKLLAACSRSINPALRVLVDIGVQCGTRESESRTRKRSDLVEVWENGELAKGTILSIPVGKTKASTRRVPLPARARKSLTAWLRKHPDMPADGYLFPRYRVSRSAAGGSSMHSIDYGRHMSPYWEAWNAARIEAGLPNLKIHHLRHTAITRAMAIAGITHATILAWFGHSNIEQSLGYTNLQDEDKLDALDKLEAAADRKRAELGISDTNRVQPEATNALLH